MTEPTSTPDARANAAPNCLKPRAVPLVQLDAEPSPRLFVESPIPSQLAEGRVVISYCTENLIIRPVYGPAAVGVSPRIGHLHITVDDAPWRWLDASGEPVVVNGLPPGPHRILLELVDPAHRTLDRQLVNFAIPNLAHRTGGASSSPHNNQQVKDGPMSTSSSPTHETIQASDSSTLKTAVDRRVRHKMVAVGGVDIFYREAGPKDAQTILLLHGFPTSSHMFRDLIPQLADRYHVIAPDYPGFGHSAAPDPKAFTYSFDNLAAVMGAFTEQLGLNRYALYMMDYGAPVGFRMATRNPDRVTALIIQNGNAYEEGLSAALDPMRAYWRTGAAQERDVVRGMLTPEGTKAQYVTGVSNISRLNPDAWAFDQALLDRPGNDDIQLKLFYDYRNNPPLYSEWQAWLRQHRPPTLVVWGRNDAIFVEAGGSAYRRDLPDAEIHMLDTGHFALETHGDEIAGLMRDFLSRTLNPTPKSAIEGHRP